MKVVVPVNMVIEFISTPGAGKTTLLPAIREFFNAQGLVARPVLEAARPFARRILPGRLVHRLMPAFIRDPLLWQVFYNASKLQRAQFRRVHPALMASVLRFQGERPLAPADRKHVLRWFINLTGQYQFLKSVAHPNDVLLFDEGFTHRVVQLFASESETPDLARVQAYLNLIPKPDLIVHPRVSLSTCLERVRQRGVWDRFRGKRPEALERFMANAHAVVHFAVEHLRSRGWTIVEVENENHPPEQTVRDLIQKLSSIYMFEDASFIQPAAI